MKVNAFCAAIALFSGFNICAIAPIVHAEQPTTNGVYLYADEDGDTGTWTIKTTCTPDCVAHVTTSPGRHFDAPLVEGRYTNTRVIPEGLTCPGFTTGDYGRWVPASHHPITVTQWWDPLTMLGEVDFFDGEAPCGIADHFDRFSLTRIDQ